MSRWIDIVPEGDLPDGTHLCATAGEKSVVVLRAEGELHAVANVCPHAGMPIGHGDTHGRVIICPFHGYAYDVKTGRNIDYPHDEPPIKRYPVRVVEGIVQVQVEAQDAKTSDANAHDDHSPAT